MERNIMLGLFILGVGIALGGLVRLLISDEVLLPVVLMASGSFLAYQAWGFVRHRFGL